ncbi:hypothetical protein [Symbiopectobacterium purcellii]|uniref:hypothetical protein n=1 Tax=Symbiopectobacterium purcellii TaxID=2871826 RepID=UPI003F8506B3
MYAPNASRQVREGYSNVGKTAGRPGRHRPISTAGRRIGIANRLKNDYSRCPDMWQRSIAGCYQNNVA